MPFVTRMKPEFAVAINELVEGLTNEQVAIRVGISAEYVRKMRRFGIVPSRDIIQKIADGFEDKGACLQKLMVAGDYEETGNAAAPSEVHEPKTEYLTFSADATNERIERLEKEVSGLRADLDRIVGMFRNMAGIVKGRVGEKEQEDRHG